MGNNCICLNSKVNNHEITTITSDKKKPSNTQDNNSLVEQNENISRINNSFSTISNGEENFILDFSDFLSPLHFTNRKVKIFFKFKIKKFVALFPYKL